MEISCKNSTPNGIKKGLLHAASKPGCQIAVIVIRDDSLDIESVNKAMTNYLGLKKDLSQKHWTAFEKVILIKKKEIVFEKTNPFGENLKG